MFTTPKGVVIIRILSYSNLEGNKSVNKIVGGRNNPEGGVIPTTPHLKKSRPQEVG